MARKLRLTYETPASLRQPWDSDCSPDIKNAVGKALQELPPMLRNLITDRHFRGLKLTEIARENGISVKAARAELHEAERLLRQRLAEFAGARWKLAKVSVCRICKHPRKALIECLLASKRDSESWGAFCRRLEKRIGERVHPPRILITHLGHMGIQERRADGRR